MDNFAPLILTLYVLAASAIMLLTIIIIHKIIMRFIFEINYKEFKKASKREIK